MNAVWICARTELRAHWRAWAGLSLIVGLLGGAVIAAAAAARRTDSAYPRFLAETKAPDVFVYTTSYNPSVIADLPPDKVAGLPHVKLAVPFQAAFGEGNLGIMGSLDQRFGRDIYRLRILEGTDLDPNSPDEAVVPFGLASQLHARVGGSITLQLALGGSITAPVMRPVTMHVVGIEAGATEFPPYSNGSSLPAVHVSGAFFTAHSSAPSFHAMVLTLRNGNRDLTAFENSLKSLSGGKIAGSQEVEESTRVVQRSFHLQALAIWGLAVIAAVATALVAGQAAARQTFLDSIENPTLAALGFTRSQLIGAGVIRTLVAAVAGSAIAAGIAYALSPLAPRGGARIAEPHPGLAFDAAAIGIGAVGLIASLLIFTVPAVLRASRGRAGTVLGTSDVLGSPPSRLAGFFARSGFPPSAVAGARMAFETGRGRTAVPVRATVLGATFGIAALVMALTFSSSLNTMLATPALFGSRFDYHLSLNLPDDVAKQAVPMLVADHAISDIAWGDMGVPMTVAGHAIQGVSFFSAKGNLLPQIIQGHEPRANDEIALAPRSLKQLHLHVGDKTRLGLQGIGKDLPVRVVGVVELPPYQDSGTLGVGVYFKFEGPRVLLSSPPPGADAIFRFAPGADRAKVLDALRSRFGADTLSPAVTPSDLTTFSHIRTLPIVFASLLAFLAAASFAHGLITSVRRRGRDLAILACVGFVRRQIRITILWQALTLALVALGLGGPLGAVLGRWVWSVYASGLGVLPRPTVPVVIFAIAIPATVGAVALIALWPARSATRLRPAIALRTE
jgi:MacB-like periplasmic core domain/FtsX-like permease family